MSKLVRLFRAVHKSEEGSVSLETILIIGAIALPILIFLIVVGWPTVRGYFQTNLETLNTGQTGAQTGGS